VVRVDLTDSPRLAADTLWRLVQEEAGLTMSAAQFRDWRERRAYTLDLAEKALGVSGRMVAYYEQGTKVSVASPSFSKPTVALMASRRIASPASTSRRSPCAATSAQRRIFTLREERPDRS
jgi:hypothetical protein